MPAEQPDSTTLDVSVVIPTFGRTAELKRCLHALSRQRVAGARFEVVLCDDGSPEPIEYALASTLAALRDRLQIRVIRQKNAGPAAARNTGARKAGGRYLAFTDDDCLPEPDWLQSLLRRFAQTPDVMLGGALRTSRTSDRFSRANQAIMDFVYAEQERRDELRLFSTSNLALSARAFHQLDGFSTLFKHAAGEDYDLCARWHDAGGKLAYVPGAVVLHAHALTLTSYWQQHFGYGRGLYQMRRRMRDRGGRIRAGAIPGSFHLRLIASPLKNRGMSGLTTALLIGLSQYATAVGMASEFVLSRRRSLVADDLLRTPSPATEQ